jgi:hypothetical protein
MRKAARIMVLALVVMLMLPLLAGTAFAISPRDECELAGGTFSKVQGTQTCTFSETPGNNQGGVTKDTDVSQKGSSRSSHPEEEQFCVNNRGGEHCPAGQQG